MEALLRELEAAQAGNRTAEKKADEINGTCSIGARQPLTLLEFDEATTRTRLIDSLLASAGWNVADGPQQHGTGRQRSRGSASADRLRNRLCRLRALG